MHRTYFKSARKNKYNAKSQNYNGRWYHSKLEAGYAENLDWRMKAGEVKSWKPQFKVSLDVNGIHITNYFVDFYVELTNGIIQLVECKGFETMEWKMKRSLLEATYLKDNPEIEYIVVK